METDFEVDYLPLHITELESPESFHVWKRQMKHWLIAADLWQWIEEENRDAPTAKIPDLATDGSNQLVRATALAAFEKDMRAWKRGNELACNAILSQLGNCYYYDFEKETSAYKLWNGIAKAVSPLDL